MKSPIRAALVLAGVVVVFFGYLQMAKTMPINADGASNALQAWEMWHGNPILRGWTVTDVSFYSTELVQFALIEMVHGLNEEVFRIATAMTYTLLVLLVALVARGAATGRQAFARMGTAVAIVLLPMPGSGYLVAFGGPNHLGSSVALLFIWLVLDRACDRRWAPLAVGLLLVWAQVGDPLIMFIGALPLVAVSGWRAIRARDWKGPDALLAVAGALSVPIGLGVLRALASAGGFMKHPPPTDFATPDKWLGHLKLLGEVMAVNYGGYLPEMKNPADFAVAILRLGGLALALAAIVVVLISLLRKPLGDRVSQVLAVASVINIAAFITSTLPTDLMSARQVVAILPMGAALAGRYWGERIFTATVSRAAASPATATAEAGKSAAHAAGASTAKPAGASTGSTAGAGIASVFSTSTVDAGTDAGDAGAAVSRHRKRNPRRETVATAALAVVLVFFGAVFIGHSLGKPAHEPKRDLVAWLDTEGLHHGLGGYWNSNDLSLISGGKVTVAPITGGKDIKAYHWESKDSWYDPALNDARFIVIDTARPGLGTIDTVRAQFGEPLQRKDFEQFAVLVYDRNLLKELIP